jgi:LysR family transcriptional regulator, cyn operon transcriptional activator
MNLRHLRTFVTIADAGGIARAGGRLNLSQPAASRQILTLESDLGVKLFDRVGRRFRLTSEGEYLLRRSRRLLLDADSLTEGAYALKKGQAGLLRVGASPPAIESTLAVFLPHYRRRHSGIELHLVEDGGLRLADRLERGDVHLALVAPDERFRQQPLFPLYVLGVLPEKHRLSRYRTLDIEELADEPVLLLNRSFAMREWFDAACSLARIRPRVLLESAAPHTIIALAGAGYGIAVVPSTVVVPRASVRPVPLVRGRVALGNWLTVAWDPLRVLVPFAEQFVEELVAHCGRAHPGREFIRRAAPPPRPKEPAKPIAKSNFAR